MIEHLEGRRLFAASATLHNGVLGVVGTDASNQIRIAATVISYQDGAVHPNVVVAVETYSVTIDGQTLGTFRAIDVKRINVFALGGNDRVDSPDTSNTPTATNVFLRQGDITYPYTGPVYSAKPASVSGPVFAKIYVEGGSGRDRIFGGDGNDTLKGGRGDDVIVDFGGRNYVDGGAGDDYINVNDGVASGQLHPGTPAAKGTQDVIVSEAGRDTVYRDELDQLNFVSPRKIQAILDDSSGVIVTTVTTGIE